MHVIDQVALHFILLIVIDIFKQLINLIVLVVLRVGHWEEKIEFICVLLVDAKDEINPLVNVVSHML